VAALTLAMMVEMEAEMEDDAAAFSSVVLEEETVEAVDSRAS
jgi:hypothetical protein